MVEHQVAHSQQESRQKVSPRVSACERPILMPPSHDRSIPQGASILFDE